MKIDTRPEERSARTAVAAVGEGILALSPKMPREALRSMRSPSLIRRRGPAPGAAPGAMVVSPHSPDPVIRVISYGPDRFVEQELGGVEDLSAWLGSSDSALWIDVQGLGNEDVLRRVGDILGIHSLAMADIVHIPQRPKTELHDDRLLFIGQMAQVSEVGVVDIEQVSLVIGPGWVASFQERPGDVFDPVRARLRSPTTRLRRTGPDYLFYALLDAVIDGFFPVIEAIGEVVDALEEEVIEHASRMTLARIHSMRRSLLALHRIQWRQRDAVSALLRDEGLPIDDSVAPYLRDVHDHAFQTLDALETYRDMAISLTDLYLSTTSMRTNEVMKTLTIMATIFIPLTFLTGVYGMNFDFMPELRWPWAYPVLWGAMVAMGGGLLVWFRRRGWLGSPDELSPPR